MKNAKTVRIFGKDLEAGHINWLDVAFGWLRARRTRRKLLVDLLYDLSAIEVLYAKPLSYNEDLLRNLLMAERNKKQPDEEKIREVTDQIADFKSAKDIHQKTVETIDEYRQYLDHLNHLATTTTADCTQLHDVQN